jgi:hypothetical protein
VHQRLETEMEASQENVGKAKSQEARPQAAMQTAASHMRARVTISA